MRPLAYVLLVPFVLLTARSSRAETAPLPPTTEPPLPQPPPEPVQWPPPGGYNYAATAPPDGAWNGPPPSALLVYEHDRKNVGLAVLMSLFVPGLGNAYAGHALGVVVTWALIIGGVALAVHGGDQSNGNQTTGEAGGSSDQILLGLLLATAGFVYSPIDAGLAAQDYNDALKKRLGLSSTFGIAVAPILPILPIPGERGRAWGPGLAFRF